jgi:hypothetical protein
MSLWKRLFDKDRRILREATRMMVDPEVADQILHNPESFDPRQLEKRFLEYVFVRVRAEPVERSLELVGEVFELSSDLGASSDPLFSNIVLVYFGAPLVDTGSAQRHSQLIQELIDRHAKDVAVVYGSGEVLVGVFGSSSRFHYGPFAPELVESLRTVMEIELGTVLEIRAQGPAIS